MVNRCLLSCPDFSIYKDERINALKSTIANWIHSEAFIRLVTLFGGRVPAADTIREQIEYYNTFADVWDYRKHKANCGERWLITDDQFLSEHKSEIMDCMFLLGLTEGTEQVEQPDYILPLGGARMANLDRCLAAYEVCQLYQAEPTPVVALTGMRPINEIERESLEKYAPEAQTEYEAVCGGIEKAFGLKAGSYVEEKHENANVNLAWAVRKYNSDQRMIHVLSAPSTDEGRRANSMDTFEFFIKKYSPEVGSRILLVTSPVYVPFQLMKFTGVALELGLSVDCIGNRSYEHSPAVLNTASYLQELKAAINAIHMLAVKYFD